MKGLTESEKPLMRLSSAQESIFYVLKKYGMRKGPNFEMLTVFLENFFFFKLSCRG